MKADWTKGIEEDKKEEVRALYKASSRFRKRLQAVLEEKSSVKGRVASADNYDILNWNLKQADTIGYLRALKDIIDLIE